MNYTPLNLKRFHIKGHDHVSGPLIIFICIILIGLLAALLVIFLKDIL